jgi:hypothetical protein
MFWRTVLLPSPTTPLHSATTQKPTNYIFTAVKTLNVAMSHKLFPEFLVFISGLPLD